MVINQTAVNAILFFVLLFLRSYTFISTFSFIRTLLGAGGRTAASIALTCALLSRGDVSQMAHTGASSVGATPFFLLAVKEVFLGFIIAAPIALALESLVMAGRIADVARGAQYGEQLDLSFGMGMSVAQRITSYSLALFALSSCGYPLAYRILEHSVIWPLEVFGRSGILNLLGERAILESFILLAGQAISWGLLLAAPVVFASLIVDIITAFLSKALPRVSAVQELMPVKLLLGLSLLIWLMVNDCWQLSGIDLEIMQFLSMLIGENA
ncbi:MAG: flagellar biosynthetic protein FliR [Deltaproteobacteria bacterium]|nr:flagellar biosynthetic protein FliR [Deltaproteobacteria bacterium]